MNNFTTNQAAKNDSVAKPVKSKRKKHKKDSHQMSNNQFTYADVDRRFISEHQG